MIRNNYKCCLINLIFCWLIISFFIWMFGGFIGILKVISFLSFIWSLKNCIMIFWLKLMRLWSVFWCWGLFFCIFMMIILKIWLFSRLKIFLMVWKLWKKFFKVMKFFCCLSGSCLSWLVNLEMKVLMFLWVIIFVSRKNWFGCIWFIWVKWIDWFRFWWYCILLWWDYGVVGIYILFFL